MSDVATAESLFSDAARLFRAGQRDQALRLTEQALDLHPAYVEAALEYARAMEAAGRRDVAETVLRRTAALVPGHFGLATNLGVLLCRADRAPEGLAWLEAAAQAQPDNAIAWDNLGIALKATGQLDRALDSYRTAIRLRSDFASGYLHLGNCLADMARLDEAMAAYATYCDLRRNPKLPALPNDETIGRATAGKLRHDIEQIEYLRARGLISSEFDRVLRDYRDALVAVTAAAPEGGVVTLPPDHAARIAPTYNRLWHRIECPALPGGAVNPALDRGAIEADYARNGPGITFFDSLLRPEALTALREFCLASTLWFGFRANGGYLGAYWEQGFWCPLLQQIAVELPAALPQIFGAHPLLKVWAYKYDSRLSGIGMHADFAAVNVNFWVTPDQANLDPSRGGLVVWDKEAPPDWGFAQYNSNPAGIQDFLQSSKANAVRVPHRQNRAVIFNSDLFHATDGVSFAPGYENRRINITMLYGRRGGAK